MRITTLNFMTKDLSDTIAQFLSEIQRSFPYDGTMIYNAPTTCDKFERLIFLLLHVLPILHTLEMQDILESPCLDLHIAN